MFRIANHRAYTSLSVALASAWVLAACGDPDPQTTTSGSPVTSGTPTATSTTSTTGTAVTTTGAGPVTSVGGTGGTSSTSSSTTGVGGTGTATGTTDGATGSTTTGGVDEAPELLSETGLFTERAADGSLVLAEGVREFQPRYALWSDAAEKHRYVYLPPETQIDTSDPDHWALPVGAKLWKSFVSGGTLVETRLIERMSDAPGDFRFATYFWMTADATDADKMKYKNQLIDAGDTTHDIPTGNSCERCHNTLEERALGFSALQLNHDLGGLNLETLMTEGLLTDPISLDIGMPGEDELTQDALGYLHANCGNCHNDRPGLAVESVPEPQMLLRVLVDDMTLEDTGVYQTAINKPTTASAELPVEWRIYGGDPGGELPMSAVYYRMDQRGIEDQMPPIGTADKDPDGLALILSWIQTLPPPAE